MGGAGPQAPMRSAAPRQSRGAPRFPDNNAADSWHASRGGPRDAPRSGLLVGGFQGLRGAPDLVLLAEAEVAVRHLLEQRVLRALLGEDFQPRRLERLQDVVGPALDLHAVLGLRLRHDVELLRLGLGE